MSVKEMFSIGLFLFAFFVWLYYWSVSTYNYWRKKNIAYVKPTPLFGNTLPFALKRESFTEMLDRIYKGLDGHRYGGYFEMREPSLMFRDPELCATVIGRDFNYFEDREIVVGFNVQNKELNPLSANLFSLGGERWKTLRQKITSIFSASKLHSTIPLIRNCCRTMIDRLSSASSADVEMREVMMNYVIEVNALCFLGVECHSNSELTKNLKRTFNAPDFGVKLLLNTIHPKLIDIFRISDLPVEVSKFFASLVKQTLNYRKSMEIGRKDFLQTMLNLKDENFDETDIIANTFILFAGGYETTVSSLVFCLHELAHNERIQEKLRREIKTITSAYNGEISAESLADFKYLDAVIFETLRKYPLMPNIFRTCTRDYIIPNTSHLISKGTKIIIPTHSIHNNAEFFPEPEKFDPDRFAQNRKSELPNGCYLPFGSGPRYCIGMRFAQLLMKITIIDVISNFVVRPSLKSPYVVECRKGVVLITPINGIWINLEKIQ